LRAWRGSGLLEGKVPGHDHRPQADGDAEIETKLACRPAGVRWRRAGVWDRIMDALIAACWRLDKSNVAFGLIATVIASLF
jgi:hypothetical protein